MNNSPSKLTGYRTFLVVGLLIVIVTLAGTLTSSARRHSVKKSGDPDASAENQVDGSTNAADMDADTDSETVAVMSAKEVASKPVVVKTNSLTKKDVQKRLREFRERQYLEGYLQRGERNPKTDVLVLGFLKNWLAENNGGAVDTNLPSFRELGYHLVNDSNCTDPLVLAVYGVSVTDDFDRDAVSMTDDIRAKFGVKPSVLERALKGFENSKHRGWPKFCAAVVLANKAFESYAKDGMIPAKGNPILLLEVKAQQYFKESLTDGSILPGDQAEVGEVLVNGWGADFFKRNADAVIAAVEARSTPMRWLAQTLTAR